jgi:hypothetical protein
MTDDSIISPVMAKGLDERIDAAGEKISAVRHEIEDELHAYEQNPDVEPDPTRRRLHIALLLSEIEYLDAKASAAGQKIAPKHEGLVDRVRGWFHHKD